MRAQVEYYVDGRLLEWAMALTLIMVGVSTMLYPQTMTDSPFHWMVELFPVHFLALYMASVGWIRLGGLCLNGHRVNGYKVGPLIRSLTALLSAFLWVQFSLCLTRIAFEKGFPSPGIYFWAILTVAELYKTFKVLKETK